MSRNGAGTGRVCRGRKCRDADRRFVPDRPTRGARPAAEVHVFVVEEKVLVEAAQCLPTVTPHQQTAAGDPGDQPAARAAHGLAAAASARPEQAGEYIGQRWEWTSRTLASSVGVPELEADDAGARGRPW